MTRQEKDLNARHIWKAVSTEAPPIVLRPKMLVDTVVTCYEKRFLLFAIPSFKFDLGGLLFIIHEKATAAAD